MQYGNLDVFIFFDTPTKCLNRTMQYGNYWVYLIFFFTTDKFKSYYVVWKLACFIFLICVICSLNRTMQYGNYQVVWSARALTLFKSYYVVWKLASCIGTRVLFCMFKSYYVVWKLLCCSILRFFHIRLNRTMQYGNFVFFSLFFSTKKV